MRYESGEHCAFEEPVLEKGDRIRPVTEFPLVSVRPIRNYRTREQEVDLPRFLWQMATAGFGSYV